MVVEESWWRGDLVASAVKPVKSLSGNLISMDFGSAMEEINSSQHKHFSIRYRGIPDLNEPITERPYMTQENDQFSSLSENRGSALLRFSDACKQIARESKRQIKLQEVPNNGGTSHDINAKRCQIGAHPQILNLSQTNRDKSLLINTDKNGQDYSGESSKRSYTQVQMPPPSRNIHLGEPSNRAIQHSRGNVASNVCTLNRNPGDFSYPDEKHGFTLCAKDLKPRTEESNPHLADVKKKRPNAKTRLQKSVKK